MKSVAAVAAFVKAVGRRYAGVLAERFGDTSGHGLIGDPDAGA